MWILLKPLKLSEYNSTLKISKKNIIPSNLAKKNASREYIALTHIVFKTENYKRKEITAQENVFCEFKCLR